MNGLTFPQKTYTMQRTACYSVRHDSLQLSGVLDIWWTDY